MSLSTCLFLVTTKDNDVTVDVSVSCDNVGQ